MNGEDIYKGRSWYGAIEEKTIRSGGILGRRDKSSAFLRRGLTCLVAGRIPRRRKTRGRRREEMKTRGGKTRERENERGKTREGEFEREEDERR